MSNFHVGQIVYVVLNKRNSVQPFRVVEMITKKTLAGEVTNFRLQGGDSATSSIMMDELDGEIFETADDVRHNLVERASIQIDKIVDAAMATSIDWFGSTTSSNEKIVHELPEVKSDRPKLRSIVDEQQNSEPPTNSSSTTVSDDSTPVIMPDGSVVRVKLPRL